MTQKSLVGRETPGRQRMLVNEDQKPQVDGQTNVKAGKKKASCTLAKSIAEDEALLALLAHITDCLPEDA